MNQQDKQDILTEISMTIDMKKDRIRIHKNTLYALGNPRRIQLLVHPSEPTIIVRCPQKGEPFGQEEKVVFDKPGNQGTFQLYSKELINRLCRIYPCFEKQQVYRLYGTVKQELHAAFFTFDHIQPVEVGEVICHDTITDDRSGIPGSDSTVVRT